MKKFKVTKENIAFIAIMALSALLNFVNLSIEGTSNPYYAAGVKSMTTSWKNFFFVSLDPAGFVTVDKPPLGYWMQALSAKLFGFHGWSILLPQALAGVISVGLLYLIVKRSFGSAAGLISALFLAVTPVFVAVSRNNTVDNQLVMVLLFACWALSIAAEKGKLKYLILGMALVGVGFNIKMLQAYMIIPAVYLLYLFSTCVSLKKRLVHLIAGTLVLVAVSLSWALVVDAVPSSERPYVGSSDNDTVMGLIMGHNGAERLGGSLFGLFSKSGNSGGGPGGGPGGNAPQAQAGNGNFGTPPSMPTESDGTSASSPTDQPPVSTGSDDNSAPTDGQQGRGMPANSAPSGNKGFEGQGGGSGGGPGGGGFGDGGSGGGLSGTFGNQTTAGITRLFSKNVLSDQIVWFIPLALIGFLAAALKEKLSFRLNNRRKQALALWLLWFAPVFIYFSYNTGLFHSYYLTMLAPPTAVLAGIGIVSMWKMYKEGGWKSWFLPAAFLADGAVHFLMLTYFYSSSALVKPLMILLVVLCFVPSLALIGVNLLHRKKTVSEPETGAPKRDRLPAIKKALLSLAVAGLIITPLVGSGAAMFYAVNSSFPGAGLELLPEKLVTDRKNAAGGGGQSTQSDSTSDLVAFLAEHQVDGKSQIVVSSLNTAENLILKTDLYVGSLSGFMENGTVMSLDDFKQLVKDGKVRYVLADSGGDSGRRGGSSGDIMTWVKETGVLVSYAGTDSTAAASGSESSEQVYDLIGYTESADTQ